MRQSIQTMAKSMQLTVLSEIIHTSMGGFQTQHSGVINNSQRDNREIHLVKSEGDNVWSTLLVQTEALESDSAN
jgi:hypothetical protein